MKSISGFAEAPKYIQVLVGADNFDRALDTFGHQQCGVSLSRLSKWYIQSRALTSLNLLIIYECNK